jgi:hypothetical protein
MESDPANELEASADETKVDDYCRTLLEQIAECQVANGPGRLEPRVVKRRPKPYKLMQKPRNKRPGSISKILR